MGGEVEMAVGVGDTVGTPDQLKSIVPSPDQIFILAGGGGTPDQLKFKVPSPRQILIFGRWGGVGGEGIPDHMSQILEWWESRNFEPKILVTGMW